MPLLRDLVPQPDARCTRTVRRRRRFAPLATAFGPTGLVVIACSSTNVTGQDRGHAGPLRRGILQAAGGGAEVAEPALTMEFGDSWQEAWLGSPAVVDLDGDGDQEIVAPRGETLKVWSADGSLVRVHDAFPSRVWAGAVVLDLEGPISKDSSMQLLRERRFMPSRRKGTSWTGSPSFGVMSCVHSPPVISTVTVTSRTVTVTTSDLDENTAKPTS